MSYKVSYVDVVRRVLDVRTRVHTLVAVRPVSSRGRGVGRAARSTGVAGARTRHPTRDGPHWCEYKSSLDPGHKPTVLGRCLG